VAPVKSYLAALLVILTGCTLSNGVKITGHNLPAQSWSQDNLKRNDTATCPNAIFIAPPPDGNLIQCQAEISELLPVPQTYPKFDTPEAAAIAALAQIALKRGGTYEWGGVIGKGEDGKYAFSRPHTDFEGDNVSIHRDLPPDFELVAGYHTHPCLPGHEVEFFSPEDLTSVIFGHEEMVFMGDFCTGNVHEFRLGDKPDTDKVHSAWLTKGRIIGTFTLPGKMTEG